MSPPESLYDACLVECLRRIGWASHLQEKVAALCFNLLSWGQLPKQICFTNVRAGMRECVSHNGKRLLQGLHLVQLWTK